MIKLVRNEAIKHQKDKKDRTLEEKHKIQEMNKMELLTLH